MIKSTAFIVLLACVLILMLAGCYLMFWADVVAKTTGYGVAVWGVPLVVGALLGFILSYAIRSYEVSSGISHLYFIFGYAVIAILPTLFLIIIMSSGKR